VTLESLQQSFKRLTDNLDQMKARSGPFYDLAHERNRIISSAWRATGSPKRPRGAFRGVSGNGKKLYGPPDRTTAEWQVWREWLQQKTRLYRELGMGPWAKLAKQRADKDHGISR